MLIEEIIRSCANPSVAHAAVASIGRGFAKNIAVAASTYGMDTGAFVTLSVERFARHGDESELRAVRAAMDDAQEPLLAGLHRILCIMLAAGISSGETRTRTSVPRVAAALCAMEADTRRDVFG